MRLEAAAKLGFYPCPPITQELIPKMLTIAPGAKHLRLLDPCAGEGAALAYTAEQLQNLAPATTIETLGVEVSDVRAPLANNILDTCICADWTAMACSPKSMSLLYLNPPYDSEHGNNGAAKQRLEYLFLRQTADKLMPNGILVYIVPVAILLNSNVRRVLAANFSQLSVYKLPAEEYMQFRQCVIFGVRNPTIQRDEQTEDLLKGYAESILDLPILGESNHTFEVPQAPKFSRFTFRKFHLDDSEVIQNVQQFGAYSNRAWLKFNNRQALNDFNPVVPLRIGHIGSLISSGQMGVVTLGDRSGGNLIAKGFAKKTIDLYNADGVPINPANHTPEELLAIVATRRERIETHVHTLTRNGQHTQINTPAAMQTFLEEHASSIAKIIETRYKPLYSQPTTTEWAALAPLMRNKRLPGRKQSGLLPAQKHVAIASARACKAQGWVDIIAEMGFGKSATSLATLHLLDAYPAILICPGHLTKKWAREVKAALPGATPVIVQNISDIVRFHRLYKAEPIRFPKAVVIVSKERAKLGPGWQHVTKQKPITLHTDKGPLQTIQHRCPKCNTIITDKIDAPIYGKLPNRRLFCTAAIRKGKDADLPQHNDTQKARTCGEALYETLLRTPADPETADNHHNNIKLRRWPIALYIKKKMKGFFALCIADEFHQYKGKSTDQARAYHHLIDAARYTINLTGTLFGGKSTDLFWLRYRIDKNVRQEYTFHDELRWARDYGRLEYSSNVQDEEEQEDGSFSGRRRHQTKTKEIPGISPLVYGRLLPSCIFARITDLGYKLPEYSEQIVKLDMSLPQQLQYDWLMTTLKGHLDELFKSFEPGANKEAQKLLSVWLQNTLSRPNSAFRREIIQWKNPIMEKLPSVLRPSHIPYEVTESPDHRLEAHEQAGYDLDHTSQYLKPEEIHQLTQTFDIDAWNQKLDDAKHILAMLRSNKEPMVLTEVIDKASDVLPKEEWLLSRCTFEHQEQRKCIVFVRQTGTRDIQPRLKSLLRTAGLRAEILPASLAPSAREKWIDKNMQHMDILIVNPKKVETGLDLVGFSTAIFYEIDYSLFTLWQAMRRLWRLGQTKSVKVFFPVYRGTMEAGALNLMGRKMQAALLLYGDNAASAIADQVSDGDFLKQLAHEALEGTLEHDGVTSLMAQDIPAQDDDAIWQDLDANQELDEELEYNPLADEIMQHLTGQTGHGPRTKNPSDPLPKSDVYTRPTIFDLWDAFTTAANAADQPIIARPAKRKKPVADAQLSLF